MATSKDVLIKRAAHGDHEAFRSYDNLGRAPPVSLPYNVSVDYHCQHHTGNIHPLASPSTSTSHAHPGR